MISNVSGNHNSNNSLSRAGRAPGSLSYSGARLLMHTAATLSVLRPRRAAEGGRARRRTVVPTSVPVSLPVPGLQKRADISTASGVRVRESAAATRRTADEQDAGQRSSSLEKKTQGKKRKKTARARHKRTDTAKYGASAGSRRQQRRSEALGDFSLLRGRRSSLAEAMMHEERAGRERRAAASCTTAAVPLGQQNFSRIHDDPDGCYRLVEDVRVQGEHRPIGNSSRPFSGSLEGNGYTLSVHLTRSQGDALLFGTVNGSRLHLDITGSDLVTHNGSRAALIGEMDSRNRLILSRLQDSLFSATGERSVQAGLVAATQGAGNRLELYNARGNQVLARALPTAAACGRSCQPTAMASLGLGVIRAAYVPGGPDVHYQIQRQLQDNRIEAEAGVLPSEGASLARSHARAAAGLLGILGDEGDTGTWLWGLQWGLHNNRVMARAHKRAGDPAASRARSDASLGYGSWGNSSLAVQQAENQVDLLQADCRNNVLEAWSGDSRRGSQNETVPGTHASVNLVSTEPLLSQAVQHRAVEAGLLRAQGQTAERSLLAPALRLHLELFSGRAADLPLLPARDSQPRCGVDSVLDRAAYLLGSINCHVAAGEPYDPRVSSLEPLAWGRARRLLASYEHGLFHPIFWFVTEGLLHGTSCAANEDGVHYPHEALQSLTPEGAGWLLVTRQRYPWQLENDLKGVLRMNRYRLVEGSRAEPRPAQTALYDELIYQTQAGSLAVQDSTPVHSLVAGLRLFSLYQGPGQPAQLVTLPLTIPPPTFWHVNVVISDYQVLQYDALAGQARLLSMEDGELTLWMQQDNNDTLLAYGLGAAAPVTNSSSWPRWGFDLSEQPGGKALLARDGDWLYSLRQEDGQPASLRRFNISAATATMDPDWQPAWPGNITGQEQLVVHQGQLTALPPGILVDHRVPDAGWRAQVPDLGGCLEWSRTAVARHAVPDATEPSPSLSSSVSVPPLLSSVSLSPSASSPVTVAPQQQGDKVGRLAAGVTVSAVAGVVGVVAVSVAASCLAFLVRARRRQQQAAVGQDRPPLIPMEAREPVESVQEQQPVQLDPPARVEPPVQVMQAAQALQAVIAVQALGAEEAAWLSAVASPVSHTQQDQQAGDCMAVGEPVLAALPQEYGSQDRLAACEETAL